LVGWTDLLKEGLRVKRHNRAFAPVRNKKRLSDEKTGGGEVEVGLLRYFVLDVIAVAARSGRKLGTDPKTETLYWGVGGGGGEGGGGGGGRVVVFVGGWGGGGFGGGGGGGVGGGKKGISGGKKKYHLGMGGGCIVSVS